MNQVAVEVALVTDIMDWATGHKKETKIQIIVDEDVAHIAKTFKLLDMHKVERNSKEHVHKPSYILHTVGSQRMTMSETSIGGYLYGVKPGTRKQRNLDANNFTRKAFKLAA